MPISMKIMTRRAWLIGLAVAMAAGAALADQATGSLSPDPTGEWLVAKKVASIRIADCDGQLWGVVASETQPGIDSKNPDPNLRARPTLGMPILLGMTRKKVNEWDGQIYNSEDGHTYSANISLENPNVLRVQGCFLGFLCGGEDWTRVEQPPAPPPLAHGSPPVRKRQPAANSQPTPAEQVCLSVFGPAWLTHQRGLK